MVSFVSLVSIVQISQQNCSQTANFAAFVSDSLVSLVSVAQKHQNRQVSCLSHLSHFCLTCLTCSKTAKLAGFVFVSLVSLVSTPPPVFGQAPPPSAGCGLPKTCKIVVSKRSWASQYRNGVGRASTERRLGGPVSSPSGLGEPSPSRWVSKTQQKKARCHS